MNRNLPQAVRVLRDAGVAPDLTTTVARALDDARLLVDPERSLGIVLHRTAEGAWAREDQVLTDLEWQALAWDSSCERARQVAAVIERRIGERPEFQSIRTDGDRVLVALHITEQAQWAHWRRYFGIRHDKEQPLPYAVCGEGYWDGVRVSVVAYDLPQVRTREAEASQRPFQLEGIVYDLARPQRDTGGDVWYFQGERASDGMPLLSIDGRSERCSLANIVEQAGPLTPVKDAPSTPAVTEDGAA
ncbi:BN159_2729 family protein [Streptomyces spiralis]